MNWYERLAGYFPPNEMKDPDHMQALLKSHHAYHKWETEDFIVTFAEFDAFIFIDYLLVTGKQRGRGIGSEVINRFKQKHKTLIVEVEPEDREDSDTQKRVAFYERNGFRKAENIQYTRSDEDGTPYSLDIYYWSPNPIEEREILRQMAHTCREIHNFMALKYYGRLVADPQEVLDWNSKSLRE